MPLPTTTAPEQLLLTWGSDPASEVTVSWSAPGTVAQPAPTLAFSTRPITEKNPGWLIKLPDPQPLDVTKRYDETAAKNNALVPDLASGKPNLQTLWLEATLAESRRDPAADMIVVVMHQCAMSTSVPGNGSDPGIRQAWLPLFDKYEVDLVLSGHEHDYERTYPVRGYDAGGSGTVAAPNPGQTKGAAVDTRRPAVVTTEPYSFNGTPAWNTGEGTVYLVLGGGGTNGPTNTYGTDPAADKPQAKVITTRNTIAGSEAAGFSKEGADSVEDAPWSAAINPTDAYGYSIFDVDPGKGRGETTITFQYFAIPAVGNESGTAHDGTTTLPSVPTEKFVFGRKVGQQGH
jgi:hypothetical protein